MVVNKTEKRFFLRDGKTLSSLKHLAKSLREMKDDVYNHHVNKTKNDFATWVKHSLKKDKLAKEIDGEISKIEMELKILRHLIDEMNKKGSTKTTASTKKKVTKKTSTKKNKK